MLSSYRVLDLSDERGLFCSYVLGQLGADVVHVEPPGGVERSAAWLAYARGSRSVELDLGEAGARDRFAGLVRGADVLVESAEPGTWEARQLGYEELAALNPALVWVSITAFGSHGPKAAYAATDLIVQAAAGSVDLCGPLDRPPLRTAAITVWAHAGAEAAAGALIALEEARRSGRGQRVEVSAQRAKNLTSFFTLQSERVGDRRVRRSGSGFSLCGVRFPFVWPCADGYVSLTVALDRVNRPFLDRLLAYMREEDGIGEDLAATQWTTYLRAVRAGELPNTDLQRLADAIAGFLATRRKADLMAAALDRRLLLVPVSTFDDLLDSPQLAARGFWREERTAEGRRLRLPVHLVRGGSVRDAAPAPTVGQHTAEVLAEARVPAVAGAASRARRLDAASPVVADDASPVVADATSPVGRPDAAAAGPATSTAAPLAGVKVLDLMWVMAGPTSTGVLAQYGATVVRVENAARIDSVRLLAPYYGGKAGRETSLAFASINAGKLSVTLDPNHPAAREVILDLVRWADVVTESFSPKAMRAWHLDYESLRRAKPDLIMLSSCLFGQDGPYSLMAGYGTMGAAIGGIVHPTGWPDQPPAGPYGAYTDACSPRISTAVLLAALEHRRRTGLGVYLDQSQIEASLHFMAPAIVEHQLDGTRWDRRGNDDPAMFPHGIFPAAGDDEWVAVAVRDEADWWALAEVIGRPDLAADPQLALVPARRARGAEIDAAVTAWTAARTPADAEAALQAAGVPAHAVLHAGSPEDPQLAHLRHVVSVPHRGQDDRPVERTRVELTRTGPEPRHVPALGEHTELVLTDLLGYGAARVERLRATGALGGEPGR
jgi:crotonobetainyl-CoA:carnitine CoA-transferase CaiB-like acyl-CoA transferase